MSPIETNSIRTRRPARLIGALIAFNVLAWLWALIAFRHHPLLLGTSLLAYSLGLRHGSMPTISPPSTTSRAS